MLHRPLLLTFVFVFAAAEQHYPTAVQYPAGVNPQDCPGYPVCDNARLHNAHTQWTEQVQVPMMSWQHSGLQHWQPTSWQSQNPQSWSQNAGSDMSGGDKYPAGVNPHMCPNYPFCDVQGGQTHVDAGIGVGAPMPLPGWTERMYPAGMSPHQCPNFPYCH